MTTVDDLIQVQVVDSQQLMISDRCNWLKQFWPQDSYLQLCNLHLNDHLHTFVTSMDKHTKNIILDLCANEMELVSSGSDECQKF